MPDRESQYDHQSPTCMCSHCHSERMIYCGMDGPGHSSDHHTRYCPNTTAWDDPTHDVLADFTAVRQRAEQVYDEHVLPNIPPVERRKHLLRDPDSPTAGLCDTGQIEVMAHGDCLMVRNAGDVTCDECRRDMCNCGRAWEGHPNPHSVSCPSHLNAPDLWGGVNG